MNNKIKTAIIFSCIAIALPSALVLPYATSEAMDQILRQLPGLDKIAHFIEHVFIVLGIYYLLGKTSLPFSHFKKLAVALVFSLLFSITDELLQNQSIGRTFETADIGANSLGGLAGATIVSRNAFKPLFRYLSLAVLTLAISLMSYDAYSKNKPFYTGMELEKNGKFQLAREYYSKAMTAGNKNGELFTAIAWLDLVFLKKNPAKSLPFTEQAVRQNTRNADFLNIHGLALLENGKIEDALIYLQQAYEIDPDIYTIHFHLARTFYELGEMEKAVYHFRRQTQLTPNQLYGKQSQIYLNKINNHLKG